MAETKIKAPKVPARVGAAIDFLYGIREKRKVIESSIEKMKQAEGLVENAIFQKFSKTDLEGARGRAAQCSISRSEYPTIEDDTKFFAFVLKTKSLDLLQRRLSVEAVRERWAAKKVIPGVGKFTKIRLHLTKVAVKK